MDIPNSYLVLLTLLWFLFYWIVGGALFSLVAVFRVGRLKKAQFSCLFSLGTLMIAVGAALFGLRWGSISSYECIQTSLSNIEGFVGFFGCSVVALMMSFIAGAVVVLLWGTLSLLLSPARLGAHRDPKDRDRPSPPGSSPLA